MSHEVETMAFAHEVPWHSLGTRVDDKISVDDMLVAAGLDWEVEKIAIRTKDGDDAIPDHMAIRRATDKYVYDIVSPRWKPVQNREILHFFKEWTEAGDATLETAGSLRNGRQVWALANLKTGFVLPGGDAVKGYVLLVGSHESGKATIAKPTGVRVVCANTMAMALRGGTTNGEVRITHLNEFNIEEAKNQMGLSRDTISDYEKAARTLQKLKLDMEKITDTLVPIFQPSIDEDDIAEQNFGKTLQNIFWAIDKAPGATGKNGWGVLNGVTYALDHMAKTRSPDGRFYAAQLGHHAANKAKTMEALLELAD